MEQIKQKTRDDIIKPAHEAWKNAGKKSAVIMGTGTGKSKLALDIIKEEDDAKFLLLSNSELLRDINWQKEFVKFGMEEYYSRAERECYQTAYKWVGRHFTLAILDEGDFALTDQYIKFLRNNTFDKLLIITATLTDAKKELLDELGIPVSYRYTTQEAQNEGILNKTRFVFVEYLLSTEKTIKVEYKDKETKEKKFFFTSENEQYRYLENEALKTKIAMSKNGTDKWNVEKLLMLGNYTEEEIEQKLEPFEDIHKKLTAKFNNTTRKRMNLLHTSRTSKKAARIMLAAVLNADPKNKCLVFSKRTDVVDEICEYTYHTQNGKPADVLEKLSRGEIRAVGVCDAVNRGANLEGVNNIIKAHFNGSETDMQQQHGRGTRLSPDDVLSFYIMIPMYTDKVEKTLPNGQKIIKHEVFPTQAGEWSTKMLTKFDLSKAERYRIPVK